MALTLAYAALLILLSGSTCYGNWLSRVMFDLSKFFDAERCGGDWIEPRLNELDAALRLRVHGQPFLHGAVVASLRAHLTNTNPHKALVLSFHGVPGVGKNHASNTIAEYLYKRGSKSRFVHLFVTTSQFPHADRLMLYQDQLHDWIVGNVTACERSLFIFDEVDKQPPGLMDVVKPFLDYYKNLGRVNYRRSIFIFLSNSGGHSIARLTDEKLQQGAVREKFNGRDLRDMEEIIEVEAFNEKGGLRRTSIIDKYLVSIYVPFLPLERKQIYRCIEDDLRQKRKRITEELLLKVADELSYFPPDSKRFSTAGCKRISDKVDMIIHMRDEL